MGKNVRCVVTMDGVHRMDRSLIVLLVVVPVVVVVVVKLSRFVGSLADVGATSPL